MTLPKTLSAVVDWLRAGYPDGVPPTDYFPLLALLRRQLSPTEVTEVVELLLKDSDEVTKVDVAVAVTKVTNEMPSESDIHRVATRLTTHGVTPAWFSSVDDAGTS